MGMVKKLLYKTDYFGRHVELCFNSQPKINTIFSSLVSLIMYACCVAFTITIGGQLVYRLNPSTIVSTQQLDSAPLININKEKMIFAFLILTRELLPLDDPTFLTMSGTQNIYKRETNVIFSKYNFNLTSCLKYRYYYAENGYADSFDKNFLDKAYCFDLSEKEIVIGGDFAGEYFSNIYITLKKCNSVDNPGVVCKTPTEIKKRIDRSYIQLYYLNSNVDANNFTSPFTPYFTNYFNVLDSSSYKLIELFFKNTIIKSDIGLIFEDYEDSNRIIYDYVRESIVTNYENPDFLQLFINSSKNITVYYRVYMKFQDFFASIGGIIQTIIVLGQLITFYFTKYHMHEKMMDSLFAFKDDTNKKNLVNIDSDIDRSKNLFGKYNSIHISKKLQITPEIKEPTHVSQEMIFKQNNENFFNNEENQSDLNVKIRDLKKSMCSNFKMGFRDKFLKLLNEVLGCKFKKRSILIYDNAFKKLLSYLDFLEITSTLREFKQLKKIIFTESQNKLFNLYNKELIKEETDVRIENDSKYLELYKIYIKAQSKKGNSKIHRKIVDNLDVDFKIIFDRLNKI